MDRPGYVANCGAAAYQQRASYRWRDKHRAGIPGSRGLGDDSATGQFEVFTPNYADYLIRRIDEFRLVAFIDGGVVRVQQPLPDQIDRFDLAGTGMGFQLKAWRGCLRRL